MIQPEQDPRYLDADGCRQLALVMDGQAASAKLLVRRHEGWAKALRSRADKIDEAETLELQAKVERMRADAVAHQPYRKPDLFEEMFGFKITA